MPCIGTFVLLAAIAMPFALSGPAAAMAWVDTAGLSYPGAPHRVYDDKPQPYAMSYSDEAAQTLGIRQGHMDVFQARPAEGDSLAPTVSGGLGGDGAMFKLQWHPGE